MSKWSIPVDKMAARAGLSIERAGRQATAVVFGKVVERSPVATGRFRGNWQVTQHTPAGGVLTVDDPSGALARAQASRALGMALGSVVYLTNNLPYARRLEFGWSEQAPAGMVRPAVFEFREAVDRGLAK